MGAVEGKTCIVTGGAVMLLDLDADKLNFAVRELATDRAAFVAADLAEAADAQICRRHVACWGKSHVLFSNAGNDGPLMPITEYPEDQFDRIIATYVRGYFLACKHTIPHMIDGGSIIITSSTAGVKGVPGNRSYVAAKQALMGLMRCTAREVASRGIPVNSVNPGPVNNRFMRTAEKTMSKLIGRDASEWFDEQIPFGRRAMPDEIVQAVLSRLRPQQLHQRYGSYGRWRVLRSSDPRSRRWLKIASRLRRKIGS